MSESGRFLLATLCGLVLAGVAHIVIVLAAPRFAERDSFTRLRDTMALDRAQIVAAPGMAPSWLPHPDPSMALAACAFDLREGPVRVSARTRASFESISLHLKGGGVFFAVTDRAAVRGELEIVVMTRRQLDEALAEEDEDEPSRDVRIVAPRQEGLIVVRAAAPFPSQRREAEEAAKAVSCAIDGAEGEG